MKTKTLNEVGEIAEYLGCNEDELASEIKILIDRFALYAIELVGENEKETEENMFGEQIQIQERVIRNIFRKELREKLRKNLLI